MSYYRSLINSIGPAPESPLGKKPVDPLELKARELEAARLTSLLESSRSFSFVRLGDMDLGLMLAAQDGVFHEDEVFTQGNQANGTQPSGSPGIGGRHIGRLVDAFRRADYVDFHERLWPVGVLLPRLKLERESHLHRNLDASTSYILLTWMENDLCSPSQRNKNRIN